MASNRAPKQWSLTTNESISSIEAWKNNLRYTILSSNPNFATSLTDGATWPKRNNASPLWGFTDSEEVPTIQRGTAAQKVTHLEMMLGQIANYVHIISRNTIVRYTQHLSMEFVKLFDNTILDLANIKLKSDQRPEDLYQCLMSLGPFQRQMKNFPLVGKILSSLCLQLLHPSLPRPVKQRYGTELCSRTLASVKPEISQALDPC